jgi:2-polyprenyl-3-methyl-5-hydroxy-6-metoxy-1,4-benzoquinol methylase
MNCPSCKHQLGTVDRKNRYLSPHNNIEYTRFQCPNCEFSFWDPLVADTSIYSDDGYTAYTDYHQGRRPIPPWCRPFLKDPPISKGNLLDIGCGDGAFLLEASKMGFSVHGLDLDLQSVKVAQNKYGLNKVVHQTLEEYTSLYSSGLKEFDVISFFEVLEHQDDPRRFMDMVGSLLKENGYVVGSVPNRKRFLASLDHLISAGDLPPHHFLMFSGTSLNNFLVNSGFKPISIMTCGNTPFIRLNEKVRDLIFSRIMRKVETESLILKVAAVICLPMTIILAMGYLFSPTHLYFVARRYQL